MSDMIYTRHAEIRTQQRAMRKEDIRLIQEFGTPVDAEHLVDAKPGRCSRDRKPQAGNPVFEPAQESQGRHLRRARHHGVSLTARRPETRAAPWKAEGISLTLIRQRLRPTDRHAFTSPSLPRLVGASRVGARPPAAVGAYATVSWRARKIVGSYRQFSKRDFGQLCQEALNGPKK